MIYLKISVQELVQYCFSDSNEVFFFFFHWDELQENFSSFVLISSISELSYKFVPIPIIVLSVSYYILMFKVDDQFYSLKR